MKPERYAPIVLMLLKEPLYHGEKWWDELVNSYETEVRTYLAKIGLDLVLDKADGYAFLQQPEIEDGDDKLPRLMRRMKLNREQALLCVVLRQLLLDFDAGEATVSKCFTTQRELREFLEGFFKERPRQQQLYKNIRATIKEVVEIGFLRLNGGEQPNPDYNQYEIRRIIKAKITPEALSTFKDTLAGIANPAANDSETHSQPDDTTP